MQKKLFKKSAADLVFPAKLWDYYWTSLEYVPFYLATYLVLNSAISKCLLDCMQSTVYSFMMTTYYIFSYGEIIQVIRFERFHKMFEVHTYSVKMFSIQVHKHNNSKWSIENYLISKFKSQFCLLLFCSLENGLKLV